MTKGPIPTKAAVNAELKALDSKLVFLKTPDCSAAEKQEILASLTTNSLQNNPQFKAFLNSLYTRKLSDVDKVEKCLMALGDFVSTVILPEQSDTLDALKIELRSFKEGVTTNKAVLTSFLSKIEVISYSLINNDSIPLNERLEMIYSLYDPVRECAPGIQGVINTTYISLTGGNLTQRLARFLQNNVVELNRGASTAEFDAGPHALNHDLMYLHKQGLSYLDIEELNKHPDIHGEGHRPDDIAHMLQETFTVQKFLENCENEIMLSLAGNMQTCLSMRGLGLNMDLRDVETLKTRRVLQSAFSFLDLDVTDPAVIKNLFTCDFSPTDGMYGFLTKVDELPLYYPEIKFARPSSQELATPPEEGCWIEVDEEVIRIWTKFDTDETIEQFVEIPSSSTLYEPIKQLQINFLDKNQTTSTAELYEVFNPRDNSGTTNLKINYDYVRHLLIKELHSDLHVLGRTSVPKYNILGSQATTYNNAGIVIDDEGSKLLLMPMDAGIYVCIENSKGEFTPLHTLSTVAREKIFTYLQELATRCDNDVIKYDLLQYLYNNNLIPTSLSFRQHIENTEIIIRAVITANRPMTKELTNALIKHISLDVFSKVFADNLQMHFIRTTLTWDQRAKFATDKLITLDENIAISILSLLYAKIQLSEILLSKSTQMDVTNKALIFKTLKTQTTDDEFENFIIELLLTNNISELKGNLAALDKKYRVNIFKLYCERLLDSDTEKLLELAMDKTFAKEIRSSLGTNPKFIALQHELDIKVLASIMPPDLKNTNFPLFIQKAKETELYKSDPIRFFNILKSLKIDQDLIHYAVRSDNDTYLQFMYFLSEYTEHRRPSFFTHLSSYFSKTREYNQHGFDGIITYSMLMVLGFISALTLLKSYDPQLSSSLLSNIISPSTPSWLVVIELFAYPLAVGFSIGTTINTVKAYFANNYHKSILKDIDKFHKSELIKAAITNHHEFDNLITTKSFSHDELQAAYNILVFKKKSTSLLGINKILNNIDSAIQKPYDRIGTIAQLKNLHSQLEKLKQTEIFKTNPAIVFMLIKNYEGGLDKAMTIFAREYTVDDHTIELEIERFFQLDPTYKPSFTSKFLNAWYGKISQRALPLIEGTAIIGALTWVTTVFSYYTLGGVPEFVNTFTTIAKQVDLITNIPLFVATLPAVFCTALVAITLPLSLKAAFNENRVAKILERRKDSVLIDLIIADENLEIKSHLDVSRDELEDALIIAKYAQIPTFTIKIIEQKIQQVKDTPVDVTTDNYMPTIDVNVLHCEEKLRSPIMTAFNNRLQALQIAMASISGKPQSPEVIELKEFIETELESLEKHWHKIADASQLDIDIVASEYIQERVPMCEQLVKKNLLIYSNFAKAEEKEIEALQELRRSLPMSGPG